MHLFNRTEPVELYTRSGGESGIPNTIDDDDKVELEKSNVLLMGPTGSGMISSDAHGEKLVLSNSLCSSSETNHLN